MVTETKITEMGFPDYYVSSIIHAYRQLKKINHIVNGTRHDPCGSTWIDDLISFFEDILPAFHEVVKEGLVDDYRTLEDLVISDKSDDEVEMVLLRTGKQDV